MKVLRGFGWLVLWAAATVALVQLSLVLRETELAALEIKLLAHDLRAMTRQCVEGIDYDKPLLPKE